MLFPLKHIRQDILTPKFVLASDYSLGHYYYNFFFCLYHIIRVLKNKDAPIHFEQLFFFFFFFSLRGFGCFWKLRSNDYDNTSCTWKIIMWKFFDMLQSVFIVLITQVVCVRQTTLLKARPFVPFIPNSMHLHSNLCKDNSKVGVFETPLLSRNLSRSITIKIKIKSRK